MKSIKKYAAAFVVMAAAIGMIGCKTEPKHVHSWELTSTTTPATCVTKGEGEYKCSGCKETKTDEIPELYSSPVDAETGNKATSTSTYIYFGVFPKTIKASSVTINEAENITMGANKYYKGSDGEWYAKETANPCGFFYTYSDTTEITEGNTDYFKVEPIKWKVLTKAYNGTKKALLLAEEILTANVPYYESSDDRTINSKTVYACNYMYSTIRAYLNGKYESGDTQTATYNNTGFLQTAFTASAQALIAKTTVDNSANSTTDAGNNIIKATDRVCANTTDKIFLLSEQEVTTTAYGFAAYNESGTGSTRIRFPTDYALANCASYHISGGEGGTWWLRSPYYVDLDRALHVGEDGHTYTDTGFVPNMTDGIVPALTISLQ